MKTKYKHLLEDAKVVAVVASVEDLRRGHLLPIPPHPNSEFIDMLELRLDKIPSADPNDTLVERLIHTKLPLIVTARDKSERGGQKSWDIKIRRKLYRSFLPYATLIDIEASTVHGLLDVVKDAHDQGVGVIISYHNFDDLFADQLLDQGDICLQVGGDVLKLAVKVRTSRELCELQYIAADIRRRCNFKVATMAIGEPYGQISRYLDIINGGPLIYGYLSGASVTGQPNAFQVKKFLATLQGR